MDYLKNFLNVQGTIQSLNDGLVYIRTVLHLDLANAEEPKDISSNEEVDRKGDLNIANFKKNVSVKENIFKMLGEEFKDRRQTKVISQGTVYGSKQRVDIDFSEHSIYGMNPKYVNEDGVPNPAAISKRLREIVVSNELKEQRLNDYMNAVICSDFYDNATSLLYVLLQKINISKMFDKMASYNYTYTLKPLQVLRILNGNEDTNVNNLRDFIMGNDFKMMVSENDINLYDIVGEMKRWYVLLPPKTIEPTNKDSMPNPDYESATFSFSVSYWKMYNYDDGHSSSGNSFGDVVGMYHNRFKVPSGWHETINYKTNRPTIHNMNIPTNEEAVRSFSKVKYYVNCTGLTDKELTLLAICLEGNQRMTPFLVDQDVDFGHDDNTKIYFLRTGLDTLDFPQFKFSTRDLKALLTKLVVTHKWYEELRAAHTVLRYWLVQPATETVEAHWWLGVKRTISLPYLGLRRAILPMLLEGDGVGISKESLQLLRICSGNTDDPLFESLIANTTWYWGEFLNQYNSKNLPALFHKIDNDYFDTLLPHERADALSSAVLGVAVPRAIFNQMGTYFTRGLSSHYTDTIKFGKISILHPEEYGYKCTLTDVRFNGLVPPSGTGIVTGLGGSLLNGTPYHSVFEINHAVKRKMRSRTEQAFHYYDLWAYGVVQRWQGYDVYYEHPKTNGKHKIYAANNVSIAMPPVNPLTMDEVLPYIVLQDHQREYGFGSSIEWLRGYHTYFTWQRSRVEALRSPDVLSMPVSNDCRSMFSIDRIVTTTNKHSIKQCLLYSTYDIETSDFRVSYPEMAVPLEVDVGTLKLEEVDIGPTPNDELPD